MATREERIAVRWERIQQRLKQDNQGPGGAAESERDETKMSAEAKAQIKASRDIVDAVYTQGWKKVTDIIKDADMRESKRRAEHLRHNEERKKALEAENQKSEDRRDKIEDNWAKVSQLKIPQELFQGIMEQKIDCNKVLASKEKIRVAFEQQNKLKSEQYVMLLKKQEADVTQMLWRMHKEFKGLKEGYETQLIEVEKAFVMERRTILEKNKNELDAMFEKRREQELTILDIKKKRDGKYHNDLEKVRLEDQEQYNKLKMNLENHIQLLEQQLEEMRAIYQLNTEKLNYNFQVLKEREKENQNTVDQQKRREKRLKETLAQYKAKYAKADKAYKEENRILSEEYQRTTKQYKELQRKFKHFQKVDRKKYNEIWEMNETEVMKIVNKVIAADRVIHEQILGIPWEAPDLKAVLETTNSGNGEESSQDQAKNAEKERLNIEGGTSQYSLPELKTVLSLLILEVPFLIAGKVVKALPQLSSDQKFLYQSDSILRALGVTTPEALNELCDLYFKNPNQEFVKLLRTFVSKRSNRSGAQRITDGPAPDTSGKEAGAVLDVTQHRRAHAKQFWEALGNVLGERKLRTCASLERWQKKYLKLLETRKDMVEDIKNLQEQNAQLEEVVRNVI